MMIKKKFIVLKGKNLTSKELLTYYENLVEKYPALISIEDGFSEHDWEGFAAQTKAQGQKFN